MTDILQIGILLIGLVAGILLLMIPSISQPMANAFVLLPIIFVVLTGVAGFYIGKNASLAYLKKASKTVLVDIGEMPLVKKMLARGWFFFQENGGMPRVSFQKTKQYDRLRQKTVTDELKKSEEEENMPLDNMNI